VGRPFHWGCFCIVRNGRRSPCASSTSSTAAATERADQLVLQICVADVEAELSHLGACRRGAQSGAQPGTLETAAEVALLAGVAEAREPDVAALRPELEQDASNRLRTADRHDRDAFGFEVPAAPLRERFQRDAVADPLDEHD
jgi:hypothetical protein